MGGGGGGNEAFQLSQSVYFVTTKLSHKCSTLEFVRLFVAAAATVSQETEGQELFAFLFD